MSSTAAKPTKSKGSSGKGKARGDPADGTVSPSMRPNAMDPEGDEPMDNAQGAQG